MIRDLKLLRGGVYVMDFRFDEGVRVRDEFISPTLTRNISRYSETDNCISGVVFLVEVKDVDKKRTD